MLRNYQTALLLLLCATVVPPVLAQDNGAGGTKTFKLDAETNQYIDPASQGYGYPAPKMIPMQPKAAPPAPPRPPMHAAAQHTQLQGQAQQQVQQAPPPPPRQPLQA